MTLSASPLFARLWRSADFVPAGFLPGTGSGKDGGDHIDGKFFDDAVQVGDGGHRSIEDSGGLCERGL